MALLQKMSFKSKRKKYMKSQAMSLTTLKLTPRKLQEFNLDFPAPKI